MNTQATYTGDVIAFMFVWVIVVLPIVAFAFRNTATARRMARDDVKMDAILRIEAYKADPHRHRYSRVRIRDLAREYDKPLFQEMCREDQERRRAYEAKRDAQWADLKARGLV
jgi:hypothetical protein